MNSKRPQLFPLLGAGMMDVGLVGDYDWYTLDYDKFIRYTRPAFGRTEVFVNDCMMGVIGLSLLSAHLLGVENKLIHMDNVCGKKLSSSSSPGPYFARTTGN